MVLHWWCNYMINHYNVCVKKGQTCASVGWFCQAGYFLIKWLLSSNNVLIWHVGSRDLCNSRLFRLGRGFFSAWMFLFFLTYASGILITVLIITVSPPTFIHNYSNLELPSRLWDTPGIQVGTYSVCVQQTLQFRQTASASAVRHLLQMMSRCLAHSGHLTSTMSWGQKNTKFCNMMSLEKYMSYF